MDYARHPCEEKRKRKDGNEMGLPSSLFTHVRERKLMIIARKTTIKVANTSSHTN